MAWYLVKHSKNITFYLNFTFRMDSAKRTKKMPMRIPDNKAEIRTGHLQNTSTTLHLHERNKVQCRHQWPRGLNGSLKKSELFRLYTEVPMAPSFCSWKATHKKFVCFVSQIVVSNEHTSRAEERLWTRYLVFSTERVRRTRSWSVRTLRSRFRILSRAKTFVCILRHRLTKYSLQ
jgi:hypothetical protein